MVGRVSLLFRIFSGWVRGYPGEQDFISCLLLKAGISSGASAQETLSQGLIQYLRTEGLTLEMPGLGLELLADLGSRSYIQFVVLPHAACGMMGTL